MLALTLPAQLALFCGTTLAYKHYDVSNLLSSVFSHPLLTLDALRLPVNKQSMHRSIVPTLCCPDRRDFARRGVSASSAATWLDFL